MSFATTAEQRLQEIRRVRVQEAVGYLVDSSDIERAFLTMSACLTEQIPVAGVRA